MLLKFLAVRLVALAFIAVSAWTWGGVAAAADVHVAVAANFAEPAQAMAAAFEKATHNHVVLSVGASGQLYAQAANGAPYEILLSADAERPAQAEREGLGVAGTRFTYAVGRLVLWTPGQAANGGKGLKAQAYAKVAIADPATAPYGLAAMQTMTRMGVLGQIGPRLVKGTSITQAYQFTRTGNAQAGFVALSQVLGEPAALKWIVPESLHAPIVQQAILLRPGAGDPAARALLAWLRGPQGKALVRRYGYAAP